MRSRTKLALTVGVVLAAMLFNRGAEAAFFFALLAATLSGLIDGRWIAAAGLICLVCCPLLLLSQRFAWLQQSPLVAYYIVSAVGPSSLSLAHAVDYVVTWAYYFLLIAVAAQILQHMRKGIGDRHEYA